LDHAERGERTQRHQRALLVVHIELPDRRNVAPILRVGLDIDLPSATIEIKIIDESSAKRRLEHVEDITDIDAERGRLGPVDIEIE
jgi:hypothetical protein